MADDCMGMQVGFCRGMKSCGVRFFMAIGTMLVILGVECLLIDSATLASERPMPVPQAPAWFNPEPLFDPNRIIRPPEWIAWSLLASGAITLLYSKRWGA